MMLRIALLVALAPGVARADKTFTKGTGETWDCSKDAVSAIKTSKGTYGFFDQSNRISNSGASTRETIAQSDTDNATPGKLGHRTGSGERAVALLHEVAGFSPTSTAQLQQGDVIAEGGMGVIRAGYQVSLGRPVAIKTLRPDRRGGRSAIDLLREAWVTGAIEHPNVVPVHYVGIDDAGQPGIVLKRIPGVEGSDLIADADTGRQRFGPGGLLA